MFKLEDVWSTSHLEKISGRPDTDDQAWHGDTS